jgi:hypothetical protein
VVGLSSAFFESKTHGFVAIIEGKNYSLKMVVSDYKEILILPDGKGGGRAQWPKRYTPGTNDLIYYCIFLIPSINLLFVVAAPRFYWKSNVQVPFTYDDYPYER